MTLGNTKSVDILVADPLTGNMFKIEVKTHYGKKSSNSVLFGKDTLNWVMSEKQERIITSNLFYIFVLIEFVRIETEANSFRFFIVPSSVVANYLKESHKLWKEHGTEVGKKYSEDNKVRIFRIGLGEREYELHRPLLRPPLAKEYENRWDFLLSEPIHAE